MSEEKVYFFDHRNRFETFYLFQNLQQCKVFVGGLHLDTDNESLKEYFGHCGEILDAIVMRDGTTKKSRGFGFVTFVDTQSVEDCLNKRPHIVDGKEVSFLFKAHLDITSPPFIIGGSEEGSAQGRQCSLNTFTAYQESVPGRTVT